MSSIYDQLSKADVPSKNEISDADVAIPKLTVAGPLGNRPRSRGLRFTAVLSFLLTLALCAAAGYLYFLLRQERADRSHLSAQIAELKSFTEKSQDQTLGYRSEMDDLQKEFQKLRNDGEIMKKQIEQGRSDFSGLASKVNSIEDKTSEIEAAVAQLKQIPAIPEPGPATVLEVAPESGTTTPAENAQTVAPAAASPASVEPAPAAAITYPQVMTVNRKFNFLVVNMGMKDNLKMGDRLAVERDGKIIGAVAIEKLYDNFAAAAIVEEKENGAIKEGDIIRKS